MSKPNHLLAIIQSAIDSVRPSFLLPEILKQPSPELAGWLRADHKCLLCTGKASVESAEAILETVEPNDYFVLTPSHTTSSKLPLAHVRFGSHPIPDEKSLHASRELISWLKTLPAGANLLIVLSGGTSALLVSPAEGLALESKMMANDLLLRSGAAIHEINAVRKHLSQVKGGRLAEVTSGRECLVLAISDVIGDDLATIGSGPFYPDPTTFQDACDVLKRYEIWDQVPAEVRHLLEQGIAGRIPETPKPGGRTLPHFVIASSSKAQEAAARKATQLGYIPTLIDEPLSGLVEGAAEKISRMAKEISAGTALIFGGEITVQVRGEGIGGRNQHLALLLTRELSGSKVIFGAAGTDGIDGNSDAAGAWTDGQTLEKAKEKGISIEAAMKQFDSYTFFQHLNQSIVTGPSGTNVMDLYIVLA